MKTTTTFIVLVSMAALALANLPVTRKPILCGCAPGHPICANNGQTFFGDCWLRCHNLLHPENPLQKLHQGPCQKDWVGGPGSVGVIVDNI